MHSKQEHPRGSIVEPQCLHQDGINSRPTMVERPQLSLHMCMTFSNCKRKEIEIRSRELGQVGFGLKIAQNHSSSLQGVISGHYLPHFTWKVDQKWIYVTLESILACLRITRLAHRMSYIIICPSSHERLTKSEIRSSWSPFEHCSKNHSSSL